MHKTVLFFAANKQELAAENQKNSYVIATTRGKSKESDDKFNPVNQAE
jgi:hypothetical protein